MSIRQIQYGRSADKFGATKNDDQIQTIRRDAALGIEEQIGGGVIDPDYETY